MGPTEGYAVPFAGPVGYQTFDAITAIARPPSLPTSQGDMRVPTKTAKHTLKNSRSGIIQPILILIVFFVILLIVILCNPVHRTPIGSWPIIHWPTRWCQDFFSRIRDKLSRNFLYNCYSPVSQNRPGDEEEGIPLQPRHERADWTGYAPSSLSGRTIVADGPVQAGAAAVGDEATPPGSMDITSLREQELRRTQSEREAEARENVDIAARGVAPDAATSRRPRLPVGTDEL